MYIVHMYVCCRLFILNQPSHLSIPPIRIRQPKLLHLCHGYHFNHLPNNNHMIPHPHQPIGLLISQKPTPQSPQHPPSTYQRRRPPLSDRIGRPLHRVKHAIGIAPREMVSDGRAARITCQDMNIELPTRHDGVQGSARGSNVERDERHGR